MKEKYKTLTPFGTARPTHGAGAVSFGVQPRGVNFECRLTVGHCSSPPPSASAPHAPSCSLLLTRWKISGIERCESIADFLIAQRLSGRNYEEACGSAAARVLEPEMMEPETPGRQLFESGFDCAGEMAEQCPALPCCDLHGSLTTRSAGNSAAVARASAGSQAESGSPFSGGWPVSVVGPTSSGTAS